MRGISSLEDEAPETLRVLYVDDDPEFADLAATFIEREDERFAVETANSVTDAREKLTTTQFDCIVSDYDMPNTNGIEFLETVRDERPRIPFILYTGKGSEEIASEAISAGVTDYLQKGSGSDQYAILANRVANAVAARQSARDAAQTRQQLEQILKTVPACVVQLNRNGEFVFANERAIEVLGLERSDVTSRTYNDPEWDIRDLDGNPIPDDELPFNRVRVSGEPLYGYRHTIEWSDGTRKVLLVNGAPLFSEDGSVQSVVFSLSDITEDRMRQEQLRETTAQLQALFEHSPDMINVHDAEGNIINPNPLLCEETGYEAEQLTEMKVWDLDQTVVPDEARAFWTEMEVGERSKFEGVFQRGDGSTFPVEIHIRSLDLDRKDRFMAISRNIAERKEREERLEVMNRRLEAILENTTKPMFMKDEDGQYVFVNRGYRELFGLCDDEIVGRTDSDIHPPAVADEVRGNDRAVIERGEVIETEERFPVDDEVRTFLVSKVPIYDIGDRADPNDPVAVFGVASDITELKRRERQLQRERDRHERFANVLSHDLRNPLNVAEGHLELVQAESDSEHLDAIERALDRMRVLIDDLLRLARKGTTVDEADAVPLAAVVNSCWESVETQEATLVVETDHTIQADRNQFCQLLENLIRNAVEHGGDDVTVTVGDLDEGFYVEDDGPGIPTGDRAAIFDAGYSTNRGGTGFGLSIVRRIVDTHDWEINVTEGTAGGARFEITGVSFAGDERR